ncbi:hypothetical protein GWI33_004235 [Rhynchophorus ferrugineus]|uniref:Uncharacterized protein n=1 Tax=Rhynchophorus ferrugineus TaxID=354439 RepID=A0A834IPR4_RHYFE|nr:hypothetical protein GWI33_004235 [Rhynchophorus ferrugineus]
MITFIDKNFEDDLIRPPPAITTLPPPPRSYPSRRRGARVPQHMCVVQPFDKFLIECSAFSERKKGFPVWYCSEWRWRAKGEGSVLIRVEVMESDGYGMSGVGLGSVKLVVLMGGV